MTTRAAQPVAFASFQEAVDFLEKAIDYEKRTGVKYTDKNFNLGRMELLLHEFGDPHHALRVIHVAGTKGKGTTAALMESCLRAHGLSTGLHTSPHLVSICERARMGGEPISEDEFCRLLACVRGYISGLRVASRDEAPTYFETTTALALKAFAERAVDWAVVEVGLGGRLDSTNVVQPRCCVVTPIGFDHMDKLGDTIRSIAGEKAGIFKRGTPVVLARQQYPAALRTLRDRSDALGCPRWEVDREVTITRMAPLAAPSDRLDAPVGWRFDLRAPSGAYENLFCPLLGKHQVENCATAVAALELLSQRGELQLNCEAVARGIAQCRWPARVELLARAPALILDSAHTMESARALCDALDTHFPGRPVRLVFGCSADKNVRGMVELLAPRCVEVVTTQSQSQRAADAMMLASVATGATMSPVRAITPATEALRECLKGAGPRDVVCVTGSFFVAGEIKAAWDKGESVKVHDGP